MKRSVLPIATAIIAALALAACGEKHDTLTAPRAGTQSMTLMLDYLPNADHVGLYEAVATGGFTQAGLDVHIQVPSDPAEPLKLLAAGKVDAVISYEPEVLLARSLGEPLVSVAAIVQKPLTSIISLGSKHIATPVQLKGKTVGTAGIPYQDAYLKTILSKNGVPATSVKSVNVGFNLVPSMLSNRVDATLGGYWNYEAIQLRQAGKRPNVIPVDQAGVPTYNELVLVVRKGTIIDRTSLVRRFVQALARGYQAARADPQGAIANLLKANPNLNPKLQAASVKAVMPDFFAPPGRPWGWQSPTDWITFGNWMLANHLINARTDLVTGASDNELLAGQGLG
jgi:putative hydroxymethylpyrimidine transport system substrate-binding protein